MLASKLDSRIKDRILKDPGSKWAYYELAKAIEATDIFQLTDIARKIGVVENAETIKAIYEGWREYQESKHD